MASVYRLSTLENKVPRHYDSVVMQVAASPTNPPPAQVACTAGVAFTEIVRSNIIYRYPVQTAIDTGHLFCSANRQRPVENCFTLQQMESDQLPSNQSLARANIFCPGPTHDAPGTYTPVRLHVSVFQNYIFLGFSFFRPIFGPDARNHLLSSFSNMYFAMTRQQGLQLPGFSFGYADFLEPSRVARRERTERELSALHALYKPSVEAVKSPASPAEEPPAWHVFYLSESFLESIVNMVSQPELNEDYWGYPLTNLAAAAVLWVAIMKTRKHLLGGTIFPGEPLRGTTRMDISIDAGKRRPMRTNFGNPRFRGNPEFPGNHNYPLMCTHPVASFAAGWSRDGPDHGLFVNVLDNMITKMKDLEASTKDIMLPLLDIMDQSVYDSEQHAYQQALNSRFEGLFVENWIETGPGLLEDPALDSNHARLLFPSYELRHGMIRLLPSEDADRDQIPVFVALSRAELRELQPLLRNWGVCNP